MAEFSYRTRGDSPWQGKAKVYLAAHPEDRVLLEKIAKEILSYQNCAVFFDSDPEGALDVEEHLAKLHEMNLVVIPVTTAFLTKESRALSLEFQYARKHHIPILPLMQEEGLSELFNRVCGELQYLDRHASDATAISYEEKLATFLSSVLVGDELAKKVRAAFDAYIFSELSQKGQKVCPRIDAADPRQ